ncbi:ABC transporter substrate-binding protein [Clostridium sp. C105KSO13]|uniref:ABC transporter substrate-binding protein n=1 Tax=Clostridium sp. C105KSO13 TaxID=1776045 RepID=UPI0007405B25|nr:ABC transporter substrate-binding protein [Clostridium sp. C105KSO13]CUX20565.1 Periplasmic binding protein [Clostridium sp. C105KSO13]
MLLALGEGDKIAGRETKDLNAAADLTGTGWADISYEQLIAYNPDMIVLISDADYSVEDVLNDGQLAGIKAVQNGAVYQMPKGYEAWDSPVPATILGSLWLAAVIVPDAYSQDDFVKEAETFYKEFYGIAIDTTQLTQ